MDQEYNGAIQGKELRPSLNFGVVAIEKGASGPPSTKVANLLNLGKRVTDITLLLKQGNNWNPLIELNQMINSRYNYWYWIAILESILLYAKKGAQAYLKMFWTKYVYKSCIYIIIIIIMSCHEHGYPWPSLATSPYHSSPLAGLQGYFPYPHIAAVCMFELVVLLLLGHMRGSIRVHHLWVRPCFSSSVLHVWFV